MPATHTPEFYRALHAAQALARSEGRRHVLPAHLLLAALDPAAAPADQPATGPAPTGDTAAARAVAFLDVDPALLGLAVQSQLSRIKPPRKGARNPRHSWAVRRAIEIARQEASLLRARHIGTEHLLLGLARIWAESMPFGLGIVGDLYRVRWISDRTWQTLRRSNRATHIVVPEILREFRLDVQSLRVAAAQQDPLRARLPWNPDVERVIQRARAEATATGAARVGAEHLWLGLLGDPAVALLAECNDAGAELDKALENQLRALLRSDAEVAGIKIRFTAEARRILAGAERAARAARCRNIRPGHLLIALGGAAPAPPLADAVRQRFESPPPSRAAAAVARACEVAGCPPRHLRTALLRHAEGLCKGSPEDLSAEVHALIARELGRPVESVRPETNLIEESQTPALPLEICLACAREFGIALAPQDLENVRTVGQLTALVDTKLVEEGKVAPPRHSTVGKTLAFFGPALLWFLMSALVKAGTDLSMPFGEYFLPLSLMYFFVPSLAAYQLIPKFRPLAAPLFAGWLALGFVLFLFQ